MTKIFAILACVIVIILPLAIIIAGQLGLLQGKPPTDLGLRDGMLKPPVKRSWNVVSSYALQQPHTAYHVIDPIRYTGDGTLAFSKLNEVVRGMAGATIVTSQPEYLYAQFQTPLLKFVDDVEFVLDRPANLIQMRSASRLGRKDFNANRNRLEAIRAAFNR